MDRRIKLYQPVSVVQLASAVGKKSYMVIQDLMNFDVFKNQEMTLLEDEVQWLANRYGVVFELHSAEELDENDGDINDPFPRR